MRRAFTLVELIVVVIIIGILLSVGIPQYRKALERSRGAEAFAGLAHIQQGEKVYFASYEHYLPTNNDYSTTPMSSENLTELDINLPQTGWYFNVSSTDTIRTFTATAKRRSGPCSPVTITMTQNTSANDTSWKNCLDNSL